MIPAVFGYADFALLVTAIPFCVWSTISDMRVMKIPNVLVIAMAISFLVVGIIFLPIDVFLWRLLGGFIVLVIGFLLNMVGAVGGGDAKFAAVMAMFVAQGDILRFIFILAIGTLIAVALHYFIGKLKFARPITTTWTSWAKDGKFPMGFGMGGALIYYLATRAIMA